MKVKSSVWDMQSLKFPLENLPLQPAGGDGEQVAGSRSLATDLGAVRTRDGIQSHEVAENI